MDPDTEEKLRSLGYLGSPVPATASSATTDPKDKSGLVRALSEGMKALARRDFQGALRLVLPVIEADKNIVDAHLVAGSAYLNLQQYGKAQDELLKVLAVKPDDAMAIATLATSYEGMGSLKEAERWYLKVLQVEKEHSYAIVKLASLYRRLNEPSKAEEYFARAVKPVEDSLESTHEPRPRSKLYAARAEMYFGAGKLADAERDLRAAITLTPRAPDLHFNLAQVYEGLKDVPDAIASYQLETEIAPSNFGACLNLGLLHFQAGHVEAAAACFQRLLQLRPGEPHASFLLAETYARTGNNLEQALQLVRQGLSQMPDYKHGYVLMAEIYRKLGRAKEADEAAAMGR
jgi:tetratricopeptide (TPR) repeat protein